MYGPSTTCHSGLVANVLTDLFSAVRKLKILVITAGVHWDGGMTDPVADSLAHAWLGTGIGGGPAPSSFSVNHDGLTGLDRCSTSVEAFGSAVLTSVSGNCPGT